MSLFDQIKQGKQLKKARRSTVKPERKTPRMDLFSQIRAGGSKLKKVDREKLAKEKDQAKNNVELLRAELQIERERSAEPESTALDAQQFLELQLMPGPETSAGQTGWYVAGDQSWQYWTRESDGTFTLSPESGNHCKIS